MPTSAGTKVIDPHNTKPESVGVVTSDSLAAESLKNSGTFGEGNPGAAASKQPSHSTTTNTTDTSNARKIDPAANSEAREAQQGRSVDQELNTVKGHGKEAGVGPTYNTTTSTSTTSGTTSGTTPSSSGTTSTTSNGGGVTGGYAGASEQVQDPGVKQPKGKNLTETNDLEGKTAFGEVGTDMDPARAAEQKLAQRTAHSGADAATGTSKLQDGESKFSQLGEEAA